MKIKPKLVDYSLLKLSNSPPKPKLKPKLPLKKVESSKSNDMSFYINVFGILVLIIGGICLYQRLIDRDKEELQKQNTIIGFHQYVHENTPSKVENPTDKSAG
jgi:hypothetical protein